MNKFVVGFIFSKDKQQTLLIKKNRPNWQVGKYNGVGGKVEEGELPIAAMQRECIEECGLDIGVWKERGIIQGEGYSVHVFLAEQSIQDMLIATTWNKTDESVSVFRLDELDLVQAIPQLNWLVSLILDKEVINFDIAQKKA